MDEGLRNYLGLIKRWWWLLIVSALIPMAVSYHFVSQEPDLYQAKATLIVGVSIFQDADPDRREIELSGTMAAAYAEMVTQRPVLEPVREGLGLERGIEDLRAQIGTNIRSGARLLEIYVRDVNPEAAALIANALADELIRRSPTSEENMPQQQEFIADQLVELEGKIEQVDGQINELTGSLSDLTSAAEIQEFEERIDALDQVKSRYQSTYAQLVSISRSESPNELSLFEPALPPEGPVPSRTSLIVGVSGGAGLGLACGAVLLMEYMDTSIRWEGNDTKQVLDLPVLGTVPQVSRKRSPSADDPLNPATEGVREVRSNLYLRRPERFFKTLLLTSPGNSEGKSFVLAHLAAVLAAGGYRVIAVDADMRRPSLHEYFDRPNVTGLSDVLNSSGSTDEDPLSIPVQETDLDSLYLLSSGRPPADPAALLTSGRFLRLLESLEDEADVILIDSPPALGPVDAAIIANQVEGTILVVSAGVTHRKAGQEARDLLRQQHGGSLLGCAVNRVKSDGHYYYYNTSQDDSQRWWNRWLLKQADPDTFTLGQAANLLGVSRAQARRWCKSGRLPATRKWLLGWQVEADQLERLLDDTLAMETKV